MKITQENYIQELIKTYTAAAELAAFSKKHPVKMFCLGRCNGKTRPASLFLRYYTSIIEAYDRAEKEISRPPRRFSLLLSRIRQRLKYLFLSKEGKKLIKNKMNIPKTSEEGSENEN